MNEPIYEQQQHQPGELKSPNPTERRTRAVSEGNTSANGGGSGTESHGGDPRPKRRKIAVACDECRARKSKCDGEKPCGTCIRKGKNPDNCTYQNDPARVSQSYIKELEARIRSLESANAQTDVYTASVEGSGGNGGNSMIAVAHADRSSVPSMSGLYPTNPCFNPPPTPKPMQQQGPTFTAVAAAGFRADTRMSPIESPGLIFGGPFNEPAGADVSREKRFSIPSGPKDRADAMGATSSNDDDEAEGDETQSFFGSSSMLSFMKHIKQTVEKKRASSTSPRDVDCRTPRGAGGMEPPGWQKKSRDDDSFLDDLEDFILPGRSVADHLLDCYFTWVDPLYPYLHRPSFTATYEQLWAAYGDPNSGSEWEMGLPDRKVPDRTFRCILNLVFAFGCQFSPAIPPSRRDSSSDVFFKRSRMLLHIDILGPGSIHLVQALILMGHYLQSTKFPNRCWNVAGMAIRVAQGLGMHLDSTSANRKSVVEREMWRRTWHGCILLDRVVSMTFGRPSMSISRRTQVTLPLAIDDEYLSDDSTPPRQPEGIPSRNAFFIEAVKLYDIMAEILAIFYDSLGGSRGAHSSDKPNSEEYWQSVMRLDKMLLDFQKQLPPHLRVDWAEVDENGQPRIRDPCFLRQTNVIHARLLNIRILLFRPILINLIQDSQTYPDQKSDRPHATTLLEASLAVKCSVFCVQAAQDGIALIDDNLESGAVPAWWYYIFYLYTAATVLLAAKLCPALDGELDYNSLEASWKTCIEILRRLEDRYESAKRCLASLEVLHEQIISSKSDHQEPEGEQIHSEAGTTGEGAPANAVTDPLLHFNNNRNVTPWDGDFDWFTGLPLWDTPSDLAY